MCVLILLDIDMFRSIRSSIAVNATILSAICDTYDELSAEISFSWKLACDMKPQISFQLIAVLQKGTMICGTSSFGTAENIAFFTLSENHTGFYTTRNPDKKG